MYSRTNERMSGCNPVPSISQTNQVTPMYDVFSTYNESGGRIKQLKQIHYKRMRNRERQIGTSATTGFRKKTIRLAARESTSKRFNVRMIN